MLKYIIEFMTILQYFFYNSHFLFIKFLSISSLLRKKNKSIKNVRIIDTKIFIK